MFTLSLQNIVSLSLFLLLAGVVETHAFVIVSPTGSQALLIQARRPETTLIIKTTEINESAKVRVSITRGKAGERQEFEPDGAYKNDGVTYLHFSLPLNKGNNTFKIIPDSRMLEIRYKPVRTLLNIDFDAAGNYLFHRDEVVPKECMLCHNEMLPVDAGLDVERLVKNGDYSPVCFSCHRELQTDDEWLHGPAANVSCLSCHRKGGAKTQITMLTGRVDDVCFQCHTNKLKIKANKHIHGPVGTGDCTICHDPHGDTYKYQLWADGNIDLCIGCHRDKIKEGKRAVGFKPHNIIIGSGCVTCHDPHASNFRFQLVKPINALCSGCHLGLMQKEKGHPVVNHPVDGKPDPLRKGRELSCTSCHIPHGSNYRFLLIGDVLGGDVCSKCHE